MITPDAYPRGTVRALLGTPHVTRKTREVLQARLAEPPVLDPAFFERSAFATLQVACARLIPQDGPDRVDLAGAIDTRLSLGRANGWRYDALPPDPEAYRRGLQGLDQTAETLFGAVFVKLQADEQDAVLTRIQRGDPPGEAWRSLPADRWFEELLVEATELFYAHPLGQEEIGYVGMADANGWTAIGLNQREPREPAAETHGSL